MIVLLKVKAFNKKYPQASVAVGNFTTDLDLVNQFAYSTMATLEPTTKVPKKIFNRLLLFQNKLNYKIKHKHFPHAGGSFGCMCPKKNYTDFK